MLISLEGALALAAHRAQSARRGISVGGPVTVEEGTQHLDHAEVIAEDPRLWRTLLFAHAPNLAGECHACFGVRWPCGTRTLAERAEQIHTTR